MDTFGEWLRQRRIQHKLTHKELADRVGCSVVTIRKIEYDERRPSAQIAELLANSLNIPLEERSTFVQVARGELCVEHLSPKSKPVAISNITAPKTNLPIFPTPLIGRAREVEELSQLLGDPQCRMLTLVGPGGIGKTRLAIEAASQFQDIFTDGVYFVRLSPVNNPHFIVPVIADAIGFAFQSSSPADPKTQLFSYLKEKQVLLLMDNLEQLLIEPGIEVLADLLANSTRVRLVATSRESLQLQDEWVFEVQGLPIPECNHAEANAQNTSVELFLQRARRAHVGFIAAPEDCPTIVRICQLMEGNPLGIELAAAWVRTLSCDEIEREIKRGLDFLSVSTRDLPARHRSMRTVFDQSWKLLTEAEQAVLRRLSVFRGGFRWEAAEQVAEATLLLLSSMVAKSLVRRSGDGRYDLHELIQQYAAERLAERPEEQSEIRARHGGYFLIWIKEQEAALISSRQKETIEQLTLEIDNLRQAWQWAIDQRMIELLRLAAWPLWYSYELRGVFREGEVVFLQAVQSMLNGNSPNELENETRRSTLGYLQIFMAYLALRQGRLEEAGQVFKDCLDLLGNTHDRVGLANAFLTYGAVCMFMGQFQEALDCLQEALEQALATNRSWELCLSRVFIGRVEYQLGNYNESKRWITEGLAIGQKMGDPNLITFSISSLVETMHALGQLDEMEALLREGMQVATDNGSRFPYAMLQEQLAVVLFSTGNTIEAQQLCQDSLDLYRELGDEWSRSRALNLIGNFRLEEDEPTQVLRFFLDALEVACKAHSYANALDALNGIAAIQAINQDNLLAFELTLHILQSPYATHQAQDASNRLLKELEARLMPEQIKAIKAWAKDQSFDQIVEKVAHLATGRIPV